MAAKKTIKLEDLKIPFPSEDIEWRVQSSGKKGDKMWAKVLAYVTNRAIMDRLDDVCGPENWKNYFEQGPDGGILCGISILINGEWVTKYDGAENTAIESIKGGLSSSMKRAAVQWGIGRYLYNLEAGWANINSNGRHSSKDKKSGQWFNWDQPTLPDWAVPAEEKGKPQKSAPQPSQATPEPEKKPATKSQAGKGRVPKKIGWYMNGMKGNNTSESLAIWWKESTVDAKTDLPEDEYKMLMGACAKRGKELKAKEAVPPQGSEPLQQFYCPEKDEALSTADCRDKYACEKADSCTEYQEQLGFELGIDPEESK